MVAQMSINCDTREDQTSDQYYDRERGAEQKNSARWWRAEKTFLNGHTADKLSGRHSILLSRGPRWTMKSDAKS